jgi:hypothetical protein
MISFTKELFVGLCRNANSYVEQTHQKLAPKQTFSYRLDKLSSIYIELLGFESILSRIEQDDYFNNSKVNLIKQKIIDLKSIVNELECSTDV